MKNQRHNASRQIGLILSLIGLIIGVILMPGPTRFVHAQAVAPTWSNTGNLNTARSGHTATLLPNDKVLITGGYRAELYDPATGVWRNTGRPNIARYGHTATLLPNGTVLIAGGATNRVLNSAELYDAATGTWSVTGNLNSERAEHTATLLPSGKVLVAGGFDNLGDSNSAELYDPATGVWSSTGNLNTARDSHTATLLQNGKVLVAGGNNCGPQFDCFFDLAILNSAELYDPATGLWSVTGSLDVYYYFPLATLLTNGKVLVAGGATNSAELYDPVTGTWSNTGNLTSYRAQNTATLLRNGKVLVAAGWGGGLNISNTSELYDPVSGTWSLSANLNNSRVGHTATLLPNGKVLVAGGVNNYSSSTQYDILNSAELYDPGTSSTPNPIDDAQFFVRQQYRDFLNREADQAGEAFWTDNITKCMDPARRPAGQTEEQCTLRQRETTSGAFFLSPEFQYTGYFVYRMFVGALGRRPKLSEFTPDAQFVGAGIIVNGQLSAAKINQNKADFAQQFVNCTDAAKKRCIDFKAIYDGLDNQQYVDKLFLTTGVNASASDRAALVNGLNANPASETRASVLQKVVDGIVVISEGNQQFTTSYGQAFYNAEFNGAFVQLQYFGYLKRDPDDAGYAHWLGKLNLYGNFVDAEMVLAFISSPEYRARFGQP